MREVGVSALVRAFWDETGVKLTTSSCTKLCWELPPRGVFRRRERGAISHAITFLDDVAMRTLSLDAWDQFVWLPGVAMPWATTEVEQYSYRHGHTIDLGPIMPVTQLRVTDEQGTYLCVAWALIFEGSVLAYNPARDEVEWVPARGITNNLSWVEERSAVALVNFVPRVHQEVANIARLGARCLVSWPDDSSSEEEDNEDGQAKEEDDDNGQAELEEGEWEEEDAVDMEEQKEANPKPSSSSMGFKQGEVERKAKPRKQWRLQEWGSIMDEEEPLAFDDLHSDSDATVGGCSPVCLTPQEPGSPQETAVEVHTLDSELEAL